MSYHIDSRSLAGWHLTKTCLGVQPKDINDIRHVNLTRCTGGASQQWYVY
ncbi:hypothetical protein QF037_009206 [Streptomyces canus]|nr:hypothetical protein [Streptomyces canus]MDQ0604861.1 hypothetical protein [Streptomyces canus]